jgi:hypothetical protein
VQRRDLAWDREHLPSLVEREIRGDQRPTPLARLDHDGCQRQARDDAVPRGEAPGSRLDARRVLRDDQPLAHDLRRQRRMRAWVVAVDAAAEHRQRRPRLQRAPVRRAVDAAGKPGDDEYAGLRQLARERSRDRCAVVRTRPGADDRDRRTVEQRDGRRTADEEPRRWIVDRSQPRRESGIAAREPAVAALGQLPEERRFVERRAE